jgi:hypothetical protein
MVIAKTMTEAQLYKIAGFTDDSLSYCACCPA